MSKSNISNGVFDQSAVQRVSPAKEKHSSQHHSFQQGDRAFYIGEKHKQELTREGKPLVGWITATISNQENSVVIEFPETKYHDSYVISTSLLTPYRPAAGKREDGPSIMPRRKKKDDDL